MKKAIIVSDTHGDNTNFYKVLKLHPDAEFIVHCGDIEGGDLDIRSRAKCPVYIVAGNNDYFGALPRELEENLFGHRVFIAHGHNYRVAMSPEIIREEAVSRDCDIVFYGHTHRPEVSYGAGCTSANPGSLSYPRQEGRRPSYIIWEIDDKGGEHFTIAYLGGDYY